MKPFSVRFADRFTSGAMAFLLVAVICPLLMSEVARAGVTWYVDDDAPSDPGPGDPTISDPLEDGSAEHPFDAIREGMDAAVNWDYVEIANGTYTGPGNKDLDFGGKAITVRSASGNPAACIIDIGGYGRGFVFHLDEGPDSIVAGLTIRNGYVANRGGGVYCDFASPTITNCTISEGSARDGGGLCCYFGSPTLTNCTISGNTAGSWGGGVYSAGSNPAIRNCTISGNSATSGGGIHGSAELTNSTISGNSADSGGGIAGAAELTNCTIIGNSADSGGALFCEYSQVATLTNCILWDNTAQEIYVGSTDPVVTYCDIEGGTGESWFGTGCIDADPFLAFPDDVRLLPGSPCIDAGTNDPPTGLPGSDPDGHVRPLDGDGDGVAIADMGVYEFDSAGPAIALSSTSFELFALEGVGDPEDAVLLLRNCGVGVLSWEITGQPEWLTVLPASGESSGEVNQITLSVDNSHVQPGAYTAVLEVADPQASNSPRQVLVVLRVWHTLRVPSEYGTIQQAIDAAVDGDVVAIAEGRYFGQGNKNLSLNGKAITVCGASRDPALCIIDCEGAGRGFFLGGCEGPDSIIENLTITNGQTAYYGGGIYYWYGSPTIRNCTISGNSAAFGGGICGDGGDPTITNCTIAGNSAVYRGGGVFCNDGSPTLANCQISENSAGAGGGGVRCGGGSSPRIMNCTISGNRVDSEGGGVHCRSSDWTFINCTISGNSAASGGGVYGYPRLTNCAISGNKATANGGGVCCSSSSGVLTNCTISENAAACGGGIYGHPRLTDCVLWGDTPEEIYVYSSNPVVTYCDVQGGTGESWFGAGCIDVDPLFSAGPGGCYYLSQTAAGSPFESPCVDAGSDTAANLGLDALTTRRDEVGDVGMVDMGCHYPVTGEPYRPGDINCDGVVDIGDFGLFSPAMTGPGPWPAGTVTGCLTAGDIDDDGDLDLIDFAAFQLVFEPGTP